MQQQHRCKEPSQQDRQKSCTCYTEVAVVRRACCSPHVAVLEPSSSSCRSIPQQGHLGMPVAPPHHLHCLLLAEMERRTCFLPRWWLLERFLHVYLNYKALNNSLLSRVEEESCFLLLLILIPLKKQLC